MHNDVRPTVEVPLLVLVQYRMRPHAFLAAVAKLNHAFNHTSTNSGRTVRSNSGVAAMLVAVAADGRGWECSDVDAQVPIVQSDHGIHVVVATVVPMFDQQGVLTLDRLLLDELGDEPRQTFTEPIRGVCNPRCSRES